VETAKTPIAELVYRAPFQVVFCENSGKRRPYQSAHHEFSDFAHSVNKFSAPFSSLLHKVLLHDHRQTVKGFEA
jgi:hypothetical protein